MSAAKENSFSPAIKLADIKSPADLKTQSPKALADLANEIREFLKIGRAHV